MKIITRAALFGMSLVLASGTLVGTASASTVQSAAPAASVTSVQQTVPQHPRCYRVTYYKNGHRYTKWVCKRHCHWIKVKRWQNGHWAVIRIKVCRSR